MLYAFFWVIPRHLNFICQHSGTLSVPSSYLPAYKDGTECSETSAYKIQTPGSYPEESIQHSEHGESLNSRMVYDVGILLWHHVSVCLRPSSGQRTYTISANYVLWDPILLTGCT